MSLSPAPTKRDLLPLKACASESTPPENGLLSSKSSVNAEALEAASRGIEASSALVARNDLVIRGRLFIVFEKGTESAWGAPERV